MLGRKGRRKERKDGSKKGREGERREGRKAALCRKEHGRNTVSFSHTKV